MKNSQLVNAMLKFLLSIDPDGIGVVEGFAAASDHRFSSLIHPGIDRYGYTAMPVLRVVLRRPASIKISTQSGNLEFDAREVALTHRELVLGNILGTGKQSVFPVGNLLEFSIKPSTLKKQRLSAAEHLLDYLSS